MNLANKIHFHKIRVFSLWNLLFEAMFSTKPYPCIKRNVSRHTGWPWNKNDDRWRTRWFCPLLRVAAVWSLLEVTQRIWPNSSMSFISIIIKNKTCEVRALSWMQKWFVTLRKMNYLVPKFTCTRVNSYSLYGHGIYSSFEMRSRSSNKKLQKESKKYRPNLFVYFLFSYKYMNRLSMHDFTCCFNRGMSWFGYKLTRVRVVGYKLTWGRDEPNSFFVT